MINVIVRDGYDKIEFMFDSVSAACDFMDTTMEHSVKALEFAITEVEKGDENGSTVSVDE